MKYETFERIMETERIETGIYEFKRYLHEYDFGLGKWDEPNNPGYVLEKLFILLAKSRDLPNYGEASDLIEAMIIEVSRKETIEPEWIRKQIAMLKIATYFNEQLIE